MWQDNLYTAPARHGLRDRADDRTSETRRVGELDPALDGASQIEEFLDLAGVLQIASGAWLCQFDTDGLLTGILARVGIAPISEGQRLSDHLDQWADWRAATTAMVSHAGQTYMVCRIDGGVSLRRKLFLRVHPQTADDRLRVEQQADRIRRLLGAALTIPPDIGEEAQADLAGAADIDIATLAAHWPFGVMILDLEQRIHAANPAAEKWLNRSRVIGRVDDRLAFPGSDNALRFQVALGAVLQAPAGRSVERQVALVAGGTSPILLSIARLARRDVPPLACVLVTDPAAGRKIDVRPLAEVFGLTPVETRLAARLVAGSSIQEAAQELHLKVETVRSYLKQVFQKTGTHRQLELVQLLQNGALPALA